MSNSYQIAIQPIVNFNDYRHFGYEALLRGIRDTESLFQVSTKLGITFLTDRFSHELALNALESMENKYIFLNCHPASLKNINYILFAHLSRYKGKKIVMEITEQEKADEELMLKVFQHLRGLNYKIALDDFGSGVNQLSLLSNVTPDFIKLDHSIIQRLDDYEGYILNVIHIARQKKIRVIAEGIEFPFQLKKLKKMGIKLGQGYLFGKPKIINNKYVVNSNI